jgi:hypothetical protein
LRSGLGAVIRARSAGLAGARLSGRKAGSRTGGAKASPCPNKRGFNFR